VPVVSTCSPQRYNPRLKMGQGGAPCWLHCYAVSYVEAVQSYTAHPFQAKLAPSAIQSRHRKRRWFWKRQIGEWIAKHRLAALSLGEGANRS
jgi:hypothetical protein